jgi:hypothetical protein
MDLGRYRDVMKWLVRLAKGTAPFWLFDRQRSGHPWAGVLVEMSEPDPGRRWAVAANWRMDHRVSQERETGDLEVCPHFKSVRSFEDWWEARGLYFRENVCRGDGRPISSYAQATNRLNRIPARVAGFDRLVHVGSLNAILRRVSRSGRAAEVDVELRARVGRGLPTRPAGGAGLDWFNLGVDDLARTLQNSPASVRVVAALLQEGLGDGEPFWWACFAEEIDEPLRSNSADRICATLGLGHRRPGEWLLMWSYPVSEAGPLYRPTVLEANDSPFHYPSPPEYPFGITMPLGFYLPACREVLHRPLRGAAAERWCTGELLQLETLPEVGDNEALKTLRMRHQERLAGEFSDGGCSAWLLRHPEP